MEFLFLALSVGFVHSFEADHLVAVTNIVTRRNSFRLSIKDGLYWGIGHTATILGVGLIYMIGKFILNEDDFRYFEAAVGVMLVILGIVRLARLMKDKNHHWSDHSHSHGLALGVGAIHGIAGSGAVLLTVLTQISDHTQGILYILLFGVGSVAGMMIAAGLFSLPFSAKILGNKWIGTVLSIISSVLCIILGSFIIYENLA